MQPKTLPRGEHDALSLRSFGERERALDGMLVCAATPDVLGLVIAATAAFEITARMGGQQLSALTKFRGLANGRCAP